MTAFEPSGDALGAMAAKGLHAKDPSIHIVGFGGAEMEAQGVEMLAHTSDEAAMGLNALSEIMRVKKLVDMIAAWFKENTPDVMVAVDSPAANFPVCKVARQYNCNVVHLAAPQMWAWAPWRIKKLRRLTDHVMCLLPFEPEWFESRGVKATFIGHPAMHEHECGEIDAPSGEPRILLLPGSRASEIAANLPMQLEVFKRIQQEFPDASALIACRDEDISRVQPYAGTLQIIGNQLPATLEWADLALTVSGTVSLHVMRHSTPMIGMYKVGLISRIGAKILLNSPYRLLPNLIAGKEVVPEFIPCSNASDEIATKACQLLHNETELELQRKTLQEEAALYASHNPSEEAAEIILSYVKS